MITIELGKAAEAIAEVSQEVDGKTQECQNMEKLFASVNGMENNATKSSTTSEEEVVIPQSSEDARKQNLDELCKDGCKIIDESSIVIATYKFKEFDIIVSAIISEVENQRTYLITERNTEGIIFGKENTKAEFSAYEVEQGATKIERMIRGFQGNYSGKISGILTRIRKIEIDRVLKAKPIKNVGAMLFEDILKKLGGYIKENLTDSRIGCCVIDGICHVGIVKRGEKTTDAIFREIINEIAPYNSYAAFKRELCDRNYVNHDSNERSRDLQKSISKEQQKKIGATGEKIISFKFTQKKLRKLAEEYKKIAEERGLIDLLKDLDLYLKNSPEDESDIVIMEDWSDIFTEEYEELDIEDNWDEFFCVEDE